MGPLARYINSSNTSKEIPQKKKVEHGTFLVRQKKNVPIPQSRRNNNARLN